MQLTSIREDEVDRQGVVCPLALHAAHTNADNLLVLLEASEALACVNGKKELLVHVNARHACAVRQVLGAGYRVNRGLVRMVLGGTGTGPRIDDHVNLARWAG